MSLAQQIAKEVVKSTGNARDLKIGDRVLHTVSRIHGTVEEVAVVGSETVVSIRTLSGRRLSKLNRKEFVLSTGIHSGAPEPSKTEENFPVEVSFASEKISDESILDQLER